MRYGSDWLEHDANGAPICAYCKKLLNYIDIQDGDKTRLYENCACRGDIADGSV